MWQSPEPKAIVAIVNDDPSVRQGLQRLIRSAGWKAETFASAQEFLARPPTGRSGEDGGQAGHLPASAARPNVKSTASELRPRVRGGLRAGRAPARRSTTKV
jgi:hypothetical protein